MPVTGTTVKEASMVPAAVPSEFAPKGLNPGLAVYLGNHKATFFSWWACRKEGTTLTSTLNRRADVIPGLYSFSVFGHGRSLKDRSGLPIHGPVMGGRVRELDSSCGR